MKMQKAERRSANVTEKSVTKSASEKRASPQKQGWMMEEEKKNQHKDNDADDETVTEVDESVDMQATKMESKKPSAMMMGFQKVQAGKDIDDDDN